MKNVKIIIISLAVTFALALVFEGCGRGSTPTGTGTGTGTDTSSTGPGVYKAEIHPYLYSNCVDCHDYHDNFGFFKLGISEDPDRDHPGVIEYCDLQNATQSQFLLYPLGQLGSPPHDVFFSSTDAPMYLTILQWIEDGAPKDQ
jgi:hypothetical protein